MVIDSYHISFFFGAGASAEFGIPTMKKLAEDYRMLLDHQENLTNEQKVYNDIVENLKNDMGPDVDIEAVFLSLMACANIALRT
jgi:NAD-dependent SIR2 family protein deacetylase